MLKPKKSLLPMKSILTALAAATAITAASVPASANTTGNIVDTVSLVEYSNGHLLVQLSGSTTTNYHAFLSGGACNLGLDSIKTFQWLTQESLLTARRVKISWDDCGTPSTKFITIVDLNR